MRALVLLAALMAAGGCYTAGDEETRLRDTPDFAHDGVPSDLARFCAPDNAGIVLPEGFCAILIADDLPGTRHLEVALNGDVFVARRNLSDFTGGVTVLRDIDGDARPDSIASWGVNGGNDLLLWGGYVYHSPNDAVLRYALSPGSMFPTGAPDTIVTGLPDSLNHSAKSIALTPDGKLFVSIGANGNACMAVEGVAGTAGLDPCPILETRGGIWRFDANTPRQRAQEGVRFATGLRNVVALKAHPESGELYGAMHGRDQLHGLWPELYTTRESAELPADEFVLISEGTDFGWPYCYFDPFAGMKVLAPEYGGDGKVTGRCAEAEAPLIGFPAHWAPNDLEFYTGDQFPSHFRGGVFVAFHGSWNRAPEPQDGYKVVFVPVVESRFGPDWWVFADGFRKEGPFGLGRTWRPVGVAQGPDGSLYVSDSVEGRIWRIVYRGVEEVDPQ